MNKNIKLAVAGAILATASVANAGIIIPAGDWTLDVSGNVNAYTSWTKQDGQAAVRGGLVSAGQNNTSHGIANGLLPNFLSFSGSTRQNDLDVSFTISLQPGTANNVGGTGVGSTNATGTVANGGLNNRQSFITFGDKSWGSIKLGKDLGVFGSDAILNDMTLLGVGSAATASGNTSLGRIGSGYIYADWKPQITYTTPNMNGFQATAGISQAWIATSSEAVPGAITILSSTVNASPAYEGKASYSFAANDVTGKVWVSGLGQKIGASVLPASLGRKNNDTVAYVGDIGANVNFAGFGLTGYYYAGQGVGTTIQFRDGYALNAAGEGVARDSDGGYVQATYVLPTKTKVGVSWGISNLDRAGADLAATTLVKENEMWTVGVYHPLTKHLNLVAEYTDNQYDNISNFKGYSGSAKTGSLGAILLF